MQMPLAKAEMASDRIKESVSDLGIVGRRDRAYATSGQLFRYATAGRSSLLDRNAGEAQGRYGVDGGCGRYPEGKIRRQADLGEPGDAAG
jgi:hypothetical protein